MTLPNFLIIGAVKASTTSIYHYLQQHPQIYLSPVKETKFFLWDGEDKRFSGPHDQKLYDLAIKRFQEYQALFEAVKDEIAIGEATPSYLYNEQASTRIYRRLPHVKLIAILRQPALRAFSHYWHNRRLGFESLSFQAALAQEEKRIEQNWGHNWHYRRQGFYYEQVKRYLTLFGDRQLRVYLFDDLKRDPVNTLKDMCLYLGIDPEFEFDVSQKHNQHLLPKNAVIHTLTNEPNFAKSLVKFLIPIEIRKKLLQTITAKNSWKPKLDQKQRDKLTKCYVEDILKLQNLIQKDLSDWL